jgi:hypothetical protein
MDNLPEQSKPDDYSAERELWRVHCEIFGRRGVDLHGALEKWSVSRVNSIAGPVDPNTLVRLCNWGCHAQSLALILSLLGISAGLESFWASTFGNKRKRAQNARLLMKTAETLEQVFTTFNVDSKELSEALRESANVPSIAETIRGLKLYARLILVFEGIAKDTSIRSLGEMCKYGLSAYVKLSTGRFHDKYVSAMVAGALSTFEYDESAHKMWRTRNYHRLDEHFNKLPAFLAAFGIVTSQKT